MLIFSLIFKLFVTLHFCKRMTGWKNNKNDFIVPLMIYQLNELKCNWKANWQRKFCVGVCFHFKRLLFLVFIRGGKEHDYIKSIEYYCSINTMTINNYNYLDIRFVCIILVCRRLMKCSPNWILFILTTVTCCRAVLFENQLVLGHAILLSDQLTKVPIFVHLWVHTVLWRT